MSTLNPALVQVILDQINGTPDEYVSITKPVARAMCFELLRLMHAESPSNNQRAVFIQRLTTEYCAMHIADLLVQLRNHPPPGANLQEILFFAIQELEGMANHVRVEAEGHG